MAVPTSITDLSVTPASNSPAGSDAIGTSLDDYLRSIQAIMKQQFSTGTTVASASTITPLADGNYIQITGTTGITTIASTNSWNGREIVLEFADVLTLTHNGATLILLGGANKTTAAGDIAAFRQESSGVWRNTYYSTAASGVTYVSADGSTVMSGSLQLGATFGVIFEGTTADAFETTLVAGEPTADRTVTLPNATTTLVGTDTARTMGVETIWIPAGAMVARTTNGAASGTAETTTNDIMLKTLDFDQTTSEGAQFTVTMPNSWNLGTVTAQFYWSAASGTGDVIFGLRGVSISNDDVLDAAFGTGQTVTDTLIATTDLHVTSATSAITVAGTPADADWTVFEVYRDISDTLNADARLHGVKLFYTTDAANDA